MSDSSNSAATYSILEPYGRTLEVLKGLECSRNTVTCVVPALTQAKEIFSSQNPLDKCFGTQELKLFFFLVQPLVEKVFVSFVLMLLSN